VYIGADIGSVSVNLVILDDAGEITHDEYIRHRGQPMKALADGLDRLIEEYGPDELESLSVTGSAGPLAAELLDATFVNEIVSQATSVGRFYPQVHSIIEIGGEDSKLIVLGKDEKTGRTTIQDFAMNTICAAGTGSFLDQQASRLGLTIEEFGDLAMKSEHPPRIAGRCSVFAKSDMIHLQQKAAPDYDIVAGLCFAMARNFKSSIAKGKNMEPEFCFMGGVAANKGMVRAFTEVLELDKGALIIPEYFASMGAIGSALVNRERGTEKPFTGADGIWKYLSEKHVETDVAERLEIGDHHLEPKAEAVPPDPSNGRIKAFLGVDVGSLSTNLVVIDEDCNVLSKRYLMTAGRPIEAIRQGLAEVGDEVGDLVEIMGVGSTGSGRYLTGDFVGADIVRNEITAQATAATYIDPDVDTIFEIGGQDSKYISLENGAIVDFEMNKVCAAGTGSFIEEQSERLGVNIKKEFGELALGADGPCRLGERCTVFMETDILHHQQKGATRDNLAAGLSYSIVLNYLNRVVQEKRVGDHIFFQGGVAFNKGVVAAFEMVTGKPVTVPGHHEVTGAIGMAMLAAQNWDGESESGFKGWDLSKRKYELSSFECVDCSNRCTINVVEVEGEDPLYYGSRCEKYDVDRSAKDVSRIPDLFKERDALLYGKYTDAKPAENAPRVGVPRALTAFELMPFFKTFLTELGARLILSDPTNTHIIHDGVESVASESCFPVKVAHGHVLNLMDKEIDYLFVPSIITMYQKPGRTDKAFTCPYVQTLPYVTDSALGIQENGFKLVTPRVFFHRGEKDVTGELIRVAKEMGFSARKARKAARKAFEAQEEFYRRMVERGREVLESIPEDENAVVIVSRPYNGCDAGINLEMPKKFRDLGVMAIPMDMLPLSDIDLTDEWDNMYWKYGQKILQAVEIIRKDPRLHGVYITNFGCGPDSFIIKFFRTKMGGKPFLQLEIDEHSADAGAITRAEAFLDSIENFRDKKHADVFIKQISLDGDRRDRTVYIPYMCDHAFAVRAAFEVNGVDAVVMDMPDEESLELGRKFTTGKECYPAILTTGDMVKYVQQPGFDRDKAIFFMPAGTGPCRFGQYNMLQRIVLRELGMEDVPIYSPNQGRSLYDDLDMAGNDFTRKAWWGVVFIDMLEKMLLQTRPYELNAGDSDRVFRSYVERLDDLISGGGGRDDVIELSKEAAFAFEPIPVSDEPRPRIGIVGEIYVRSNRFSNNDIIRTVESLGGEVLIPPVGEWFFYTSYTRYLDARKRSDYRTLLRNTITEYVQSSDAHKIEAPFEPTCRNFHEPKIKETIGYGEKYVHRTFEGEAIITVGKAIDFIKKGCTGVVNVMPFTCMPGTVVTAIFKTVQRDYDNVPVLNMAYDGLEQANTLTRIEAFMHQAEQRMETRLETARG
jgi:predicted CoA-substrate-specific enzyme activase